MMRHISTVTIAAGAFAACLAFPAVPYAEMQGQQGSGTQGAATNPGNNPGTATQQRDPAGGYYQMYQANGTITNLDENAGRVTIRLSNGEDVKLNLPATALHEFDDGDKVTVRTQLTMAERTGTTGGTKGSTANTGSAGNTTGGNNGRMNQNGTNQ